MVPKRYQNGPKVTPKKGPKVPVTIRIFFSIFNRFFRRATARRPVVVVVRVGVYRKVYIRHRIDDKTPAKRYPPGVKGPACGCQQAKAKQQACYLFKLPCKRKENRRDGNTPLAPSLGLAHGEIRGKHKKNSCAKECQVRTPDKGDAAAFHDVWGLWSTGNPICGGRRQFLLSEMCSGQRARKALVLCLITGIIVRKPYLNYSDAMITMITSATLPDVSSLELERIFFSIWGQKSTFFFDFGVKN